MFLKLKQLLTNLLSVTSANWVSGRDEFSIGIFRILLGSLCLFYYALLGPDWLTFYGPNSLAPSVSTYWMDVPLFHMLDNMRTAHELIIYYRICLLASVCLILGIGWKIPIFWLWIANFSILYKNYAVGNAEVQVFAVILWFCLFLPLNCSMRFFQFKIVKKLNKAPWAYYSLFIYFSLIYLISLPARLISDPAWTDGSLVYYATQDVLYSRWPGNSLFAWGNGIFSKIGTCSTLAIESICPVLLYFRRTRASAAICLACLHAFLLVFLEGVAMFNLCMIVGLSIFFPWARILQMCRSDIHKGNDIN